jgi:hypothetical protein
MSTTTDTKAPATTTATDKADSKVTPLKAKDPAVKPDKAEKKTGDQASYLAIALHSDLRSRLDATAKSEGVSAASVIRKAISQHFAAMDNANADTATKVDQVQAGLHATLAKLAKLDRVVEALYADTVRVADRLARATAEKA